MKKVILEDKKCCLSWYAYYLLLYRTEYLNVKKCSFELNDYDLDSNDYRFFEIRSHGQNLNCRKTQFTTTLFYVVYEIFKNMNQSQTYGSLNPFQQYNIQSQIKKIKVDWFQLIPNHVPLESFSNFQSFKTNNQKTQCENIIHQRLLQKNYCDSIYQGSIYHWIGLCENFLCFRMNTNLSDIHFGNIFNDDQKLKYLYQWMNNCQINKPDVNSNQTNNECRHTKKCSDFSKKQHIQQMKNYFIYVSLNLLFQLICNPSGTIKKTTWEDVCLKNNEMNTWLKSIIISKTMTKIRLRNVRDLYVDDLDDFWNQQQNNQQLNTIDICLLSSEKSHHLDKFLNKFSNIKNLKMDMYYDSIVSLKTLNNFKQSLRHLYLSNVSVKFRKENLNEFGFNLQNQNDHLVLDSVHLGDNCLFEKYFDKDNNLFNQLKHIESIFISESLEKNNHVQYCIQNHYENDTMQKVTILRNYNKKNKLNF